MHNGGFRCARGCGGAITVAPGCIFLGRRDLRNGVYVYFGRSAGPCSDWNVSVAKPVSGAAIGACGGIIIVGGFAAAMLFFGLVNWLLGGPFPYLLNQVRALSAVAANRFKYDEPLLSWASQAYWLFATAITFVFSFLYVIIKQKAAINKLRCESRFGSDPELSLFIICLGTVTASFIFILLQADHFYVLQMDYNADALLPFAYLSIGGELSVAMAKMPSQFGKIGIFAAFAGITLIAVRLATVGVLPREELFSNLPLDVGWVMAGALLLLLVVLQSRQFWGMECGCFVSVVRQHWSSERDRDCNGV